MYLVLWSCSRGRPKKLCWEGFSTGLDLLVLYKLARFRVAERWNQLYIVCRRMDGTRVQFGATWVVLPFYFNLCYWLWSLWFNHYELFLITLMWSYSIFQHWLPLCSHTPNHLLNWKNHLDRRAMRYTTLPGTGIVCCSTAVPHLTIRLCCATCQNNTTWQ